jgi:Arc/MetJ-type ribon-helix-helix transcriptional regulator
LICGHYSSKSALLRAQMRQLLKLADINDARLPRIPAGLPLDDQ